MENNSLFIGLWLVCGVVTVVAAVPAHRSRAALLAGRWAVGVLFVVGGALLHAINLASGADYSGFADPAFFPWVTNAWQAIVVPYAVVFIGLLALFEAVVGVLAICGGRATQIGYAGVIAFYLLLWLFGWMELVWVLVLIGPMLVLLRAEHRAASASRGRRPFAERGSDIAPNDVT